MVPQTASAEVRRSWCGHGQRTTVLPAGQSAFDVSRYDCRDQQRGEVVAVMRKPVLLLLSVATVAALAVSLLFLVRDSIDLRLTASSGSYAQAPGSGKPEAITWRTDAETVGAWIELSYSRPTRVDRVEVVGPERADTGFTSAILTFDGGGSLLVTAGPTGDVDVTFSARTVSRVRLTVADVPRDATSVTLAGLSVDGTGNWAAEPEGDRERLTAMTSSTAGAAATALSDGAPGEGDTGKEWEAAPDDRAPWAELSWARPREVASVQVFGPTSTAGDAVTAPLHGRLWFDDGSSVVVSGIAGGDDEATTIAFTPRMVTSVRLEIERTVPDATVGLRELAVHDAGTTPPRWPQKTPGYSVAPPPAEPCQASSVAVADPTPGRLTLVCPSPGTAVGGSTTVVVAADPYTELEALMWTGVSRAGSGSREVIASARATADGRAVLSVDTSRAPHGPLTLKVQEVGGDLGSHLYVQLVNRTGRPVRADSSAPAGMTLQWAEEFTRPVSISSSGADADYAATKPDASSSGQFGDALFMAPASGTGILATIEGEYLRVRARPADDATRGRPGSEHLSGILASADAGGAGFAAQYGYYEARILGAPGPGTWPAFWMLNTESAARQSDTSAEVDAVELYGHNTLGSCHVVHSWGAPALPDDESEPYCQDQNGFADWAMAWHTYGVRITANGSAFSIDGHEVLRLSGLSHSSEPFFFVLNLALGGGWPVDLSPTAGIADMYVDWVYVYT